MHVTKMPCIKYTTYITYISLAPNHTMIYLKKTWHYKAWHGMTFSYITLQYHSCKHGMYYVHVNLCTYLPIYLAMLHASVPTLIHCKKYITRPYIKNHDETFQIMLHCMALRQETVHTSFYFIRCNVFITNITSM